MRLKQQKELPSLKRPSRQTVIRIVNRSEGNGSVHYPTKQMPNVNANKNEFRTKKFGDQSLNAAKNVNLTRVVTLEIIQFVFQLQ